jgi:hypothetical protein
MEQLDALGLTVQVGTHEEISERFAAEPGRGIYVVARVEDQPDDEVPEAIRVNRARTICENCNAPCWYDITTLIPSAMILCRVCVPVDALAEATLYSTPGVLSAVREAVYFGNAGENSTPELVDTIMDLADRALVAMVREDLDTAAEAVYRIGVEGGLASIITVCISYARLIIHFLNLDVEKVTWFTTNLLNATAGENEEEEKEIATKIGIFITAVVVEDLLYCIDFMTELETMKQQKVFHGLLQLAATAGEAAAVADGQGRAR